MLIYRYKARQVTLNAGPRLVNRLILTFTS
jgi:hypothetical protein